MTHYTETPNHENQYIEFKEEQVTSRDLADEIVAFSNAEGGEIWLGIRDDGKAVGLSQSHEEDVMNICRTAVIPPVHPEYEDLWVDAGEGVDAVRVARIKISKGVDRPYYTSRNRYYIRVGTTKRVASREELVRLFQASGLFHYDLVELDQATLAHLNLSQAADYFSRYRISFVEESEEERIRLLRASDVLGVHDKPTVGGLLIFGISPERILPQAGVSLAVFDGCEIGEKLLDKKSFVGSLPHQVDNALVAIRANIATPSNIQGAKRIEKAAYPDKVFREILVNACVHRNYSIVGAQIRVFLFKDRIEFISPGRLPNTVNVEKLIVGTSFARNPLIVRFMENMGYMDKLGRGLPMVHQEAVKLEKQLSFVDEGEEFRVILEL